MCVWVWCAHLPRLLQRVCSDSPAYATAIAKSLGPDARLGMLLYHDEAQGGNILAVRKHKKATLFYACWEQLRWTAHQEQCWLPVAFIQHDECKKVDGGLSCVLARVLRHMWQTASQGIALTLEGASRHVSLANTCKLLCDFDAQRACFGVTGSAGVKCCLFCGNVLKKGTGIGRAPFVEFTEWNRAKFLQMRDHEHTEAADALRALTRSKDIKAFEKSSGLKLSKHGLLHDPLARAILPVSHCVPGLQSMSSNP